MKTFFVICSNSLISQLCASILPSEDFHSSITVKSTGQNPQTHQAWELGLQDLRSLWQKAAQQDVRIEEFRVATRRSQKSETFRFVKRDEWHTGYISRNVRAQVLRNLIASKKSKTFA